MPRTKENSIPQGKKKPGNVQGKAHRVPNRADVCVLTVDVDSSELAKDKAAADHAINFQVRVGPTAAGPWTPFAIATWENFEADAGAVNPSIRLPVARVGGQFLKVDMKTRSECDCGIDIEFGDDD